MMSSQLIRPHTGSPTWGRGMDLRFVHDTDVAASLIFARATLPKTEGVGTADADPGGYRRGARGLGDRVSLPGSGDTPRTLTVKT